MRISAKKRKNGDLSALNISASCLYEKKNLDSVFQKYKNFFIIHWDKICLFLIAFSLQIPLLQRGLDTIDGGYWMLAGSRILHGDIPYKDFHLGYSPLNFYLISAFFGAFGETFLTYRIYRMLIEGFLLVVTYAVARQLMPKRFAWIPSMLVLTAGTTLWTRSLALMGGMLGLMVAIEQRKMKSYFAMGLLLALVLWVGQEMGLLLFVTSVAVLPLSFMNKVTKENRTLLPLKIDIRGCICAYGSFVSGLILGLLPGVMYLFCVDALSPMFQQVFADTTEMLRFTHKPYPSLIYRLPWSITKSSIGQWADYVVFTGSWYIPFLTYLVVISWMCCRLKSEWGTNDSKSLVVLIVGIGSLAFPFGPGDWSHLLYALPPTWILLSLGLSRFNTSRIVWRWPTVSLRVNILHFVLFFFISAFLGLSLLTTLKSRLVTFNLKSQPLQVAGQVFRFTNGKGRELQELVRSIKTNLYEGELFISAYDPGLYLLLNQTNPLFMNSFGPGHLNPGSEKRTIDEIKSNPRIKLLIIQERSPWTSSGLSLSVYAPHLDRYLERTFSQITKRIGPYKIMTRNEFGPSVEHQIFKQ